jgi:hypothetical protein
MNIAVASPRFCRYARAHRSSLLREGVRFGHFHNTVHREGRGHIVPKAFEIPVSSSVFPFLLSHPLATLTMAVVAAIVVPWVVKVRSSTAIRTLPEQLLFQKGVVITKVG